MAEMKTGKQIADKFPLEWAEPIQPEVARTTMQPPQVIKDAEELLAKLEKLYCSDWEDFRNWTTSELRSLEETLDDMNHIAEEGRYRVYEYIYGVSGPTWNSIFEDILRKEVE